MAQVLRHVHNLPATHHPDVIVGLEGSDDAGVYRMSDDVAIVQTVDYFTPIVDDPFDWGRIATANALSDVYAMGGTPLTALQIVGWPRDLLPLDMLGDVLQGAADVLARAACTLLGGHSIDDQEPKFGLAVTGVIHPDDIVTNAAGSPNDVLILTKPLGTGVIATAIKNQAATDEVVAGAVESMVELNEGASRAMRRIGVRCATDVTGFGLLGHLSEIVKASGVSAEVESAAVPFLPGARDLVDGGHVPGGTRRNLDAINRYAAFGSLEDPMRILLADAQTSGGLLIAVAAPLQGAMLQALEDEGVTGWVIGRLISRSFSDGPAGAIRVS